MFLDAEIQKRFPIYENIRRCVIALLWIVADIGVLFCGYLAYIRPSSLTSDRFFDITFSWSMILKPVAILTGALFVGLIVSLIERRKRDAQNHIQHEKHLLKIGLKDVMWASICFVLVFSFLDTGFVPLFYLMGVHTYAGIYAGLKFVIPALIYLLFFNILLYLFKKTRIFGAYFMLFLLLLMALRGELSLQTLGDPNHYFGEWTTIAVVIYILLYLIPFYIWSFMSMTKDLKSPYFQITDLYLEKNSGASMAFNDIQAVEVVNWFALLGVYGVRCTGVRHTFWDRGRLLLFWFDKDTAHALKDYLQERVGRLHAK